jgi:hypothetical protein
MISPFTPPGTKVVCVDDDDSGKYTMGVCDNDTAMPIRKGEVYTVVVITPDDWAKNFYAVMLHEVPLRNDRDTGYDIARFDYIDTQDQINEIEKEDELELI